MTLVGSTVGHIRVVERLARGGMGRIYVGFDETLEREVVLEIPGGIMEADEQPAACAARELQEETGFVASRIETFGPLLPNPALNTARVHVAVATGCVQAAAPNPTGAVPVHEAIHDKPIVKVPGCPPIAEVMTGLLTYVLTFDRLPELDRVGRPRMFYGQRIHDKCYRRPYFDAGQFVEEWDDDGARKGWCLYKMGCRGPTTYNSCSTFKWNNGVSFPIGSGHGCIGCSEANFWDNGPFYERQSGIPLPGVESTPETIGKVAAGVTGAAVAAHLTAVVVKNLRDRAKSGPETAEPENAEN